MYVTSWNSLIRVSRQLCSSPMCLTKCWLLPLPVNNNGWLPMKMTFLLQPSGYLPLQTVRRGSLRFPFARKDYCLLEVWAGISALDSTLILPGWAAPGHNSSPTPTPVNNPEADRITLQVCFSNWRAWQHAVFRFCFVGSPCKESAVGWLFHALKPEFQCAGIWRRVCGR